MGGRELWPRWALQPHVFTRRFSNHCSQHHVYGCGISFSLEALIFKSPDACLLSTKIRVVLCVQRVCQFTRTISFTMFLGIFFRNSMLIRSYSFICFSLLINLSLIRFLAQLVVIQLFKSQFDQGFFSPVQGGLFLCFIQSIIQLSLKFCQFTQFLSSPSLLSPCFDYVTMPSSLEY